MKLKERKVVLITGPAGSGKTSLAERIAQNKNWVLVSEDVHWGEIHKDRTSGGRTPEEQEIVQPAVLQQVRELLFKGKDVVLEFLIYEDPPKPLIYYYKELLKETNQVCVAVLQPSEAAIWERKRKRGRLDDQNYEKELRNARHQLACLESNTIREEWRIDSSNLTVEEIYIQFIRDFVEEST